MIPTAIRRWREVVKGGIPVVNWDSWDVWVDGNTRGKGISILDKETLIIYRRPRIVIRWSPLSVAIDRLLQRHKEGK